MTAGDGPLRMTAPAEPEGAWLARAQAGDRHAFAQLVRRYQGPLRRQLRRLAGDPQLADDLAQQAFVQAWRGRSLARGTRH